MRGVPVVDHPPPPRIPAGHIESWDILKTPRGLYVAAGVKNGLSFRTSEVLEIDRGGTWLRTRNSVYALSKHNPAGAMQAARGVDGAAAAQYQTSGFMPSQPGSDAAPAGFRTAQGSLYRLGADGTTTRLKLSAGKGAGEVHHPALALYVSQQASNIIMPLYLARETLRLGAHDSKRGTFHPLEDELNLPPGSVPWVCVFDRESNLAIRGGPARSEPAIGLVPVEKSYGTNDLGERIGTVHIGNPIVALLCRDELDAAWEASVTPGLKASQNTPTPGR